MTSDFDLSIREIDDLLQHLYLKLRGKKEGLSLAEPGVILLALLKKENPAFYAPQIARFTPIIMDTVISGASISFGYEGLQSLYEVASDIELAKGEYVPAGIEDGLLRIRDEIDSISSSLSGEALGARQVIDASGKSETGTGGFFRESAWGTVGLPLVSTYNTGKTPFSTGRVVKARVEIRITGEWSIRRKHDPAVIFDHISAEPNSTFENQIRTAVKVAENYAAAMMGMKGIERVPREYRISLPEIASFPTSAIQRLSGGSAGLAVAALLISVLSNLDLYKQRLRFDSLTSFTGKVDDDGKILAVEDSHIADKVRAVFFSRFSRLILPAGNLETAEKELDSLSEEHPARRLDLIPAPDVTGIFRDSDVSEKSATPAGKPLLQRLFMWRKHLLSSLVPILLIVLFGFILPPYLDKKVKTVEFSDGGLRMQNRYGRRVAVYKPEFYVAKDRNHTKISRHDLNDHPGEEILVISSESRQSKRIKTEFERLHFLVFSDEGRLLQSHVYDQEEVMGRELDYWAYEKRMTLIASEPVFLDELGKGVVVTGTNYGTFTPASIIKADVNTGHFEVFFHRGYFPEMTAGDFDGDGKRDLLFAGFNTSLDASVMVVLDPAHMTGSSPRDHNYNVPNMADDIAKYYIKFPEFHMFVRLNGEMYPLGISILNAPDTLHISIKSRAEDVQYSFVDDFRLCAAEVLLSHNVGWRRPDSISRFEYVGKADDEKELMAGIRYWDGEEWVAEPTINRAYLEYSGTVIDSTITQVSHNKTMLMMKNNRGLVIRTYDVGFDISKSSSYKHVSFGDHLKDNGNEILVVLSASWHSDESDPDRNKIFIMVFDDRGGLLHRYVYHEASLLNSSMERTANRISMQMIKTTSTFRTELGPGWIFIGTNHKSEPPASLVRISLDDGSFETFFHKGIMPEMAVRDIDGDGRKELLLLGYNLALDAAVIIVLNPDHIDGASPRGARYELAERERDIAKYYIKLPSFHRFIYYVSRVRPLYMSILENADSFRFILKSRTEEVLYTIGDGMIFSRAEVVNEVLSSRGRQDSLTYLDYPQKAEEERALLEGIRYWDGDKWVAEPTVNRAYMKFIREGG